MPNPSRFATNNHGVQVKPLDFDAPGAPTTKTFHGVSIVVNGNTIGRIQSWQPQMYSRAGELVYELNHLTFGRPVDYVPGRNESYTISCTRAEVWNEEFERTLGYPNVWADLIDQDRPFTVNEFLFRGNTVNRVWVYTGCWFTNKNVESFSVDANPRVMVSAEIAFVSRVRAV